MEFFRVLNGEKNHLLQLLFSFLQSTDVLPLNVGNLDHSLTQRSWVHLAHGELEVVLGDSHGLKNLGVDLLVLNINNVHLLPDALQGTLSAESSNISTNETVSVFGHCFKVNVL